MNIVGRFSPGRYSPAPVCIDSGGFYYGLTAASASTQPFILGCSGRAASAAGVVTAALASPAVAKNYLTTLLSRHSVPYQCLLSLPRRRQYTRMREPSSSSSIRRRTISTHVMLSTQLCRHASRKSLRWRGNARSDPVLCLALRLHVSSRNRSRASLMSYLGLPRFAIQLNRCKELFTV
jgi:hypothetical protein